MTDFSVAHSFIENLGYDNQVTVGMGEPLIGGGYSYYDERDDDENSEDEY